MAEGRKSWVEMVFHSETRDPYASVVALCLTFSKRSVVSPTGHDSRTRDYYGN